MTLSLLGPNKVILSTGNGAKEAAESAISASASAAAALTASNDAQTARNGAESAASAAASSEDNARHYRDQVFAATVLDERTPYDTVGDGETDTADGDMFTVLDPVLGLVLYRNDSGTGILIGTVNSGGNVYSNRVAAQAANVPTPVKRILVSAPNDHILAYVRAVSPAGAALTTNAGAVGWKPDGDIYPDHWTENTTPGTTNMTTAIQSAITYVGALPGGGTVRLRDAAYFVSSTITISTNDTNLIGAGETATELRRSGDYGHTIVVTGNDATGLQIERNEVSGIRFRSTGITTSGAHVWWNGTFISRMQNVYFQNGFIAVRFSGATNMHVENVRALWSNLYAGVVTGRRFFIFDRAAATYGHPSSGDVFIDSFNMRTGGTNPYVEVGCEIQACDGLWFVNGHYGGASVANLLLNSVDAQDNIDLVFHNSVMFDANIGHGIQFSGSANMARNIYFSACNCKGGGIGGTGVWVDSGARIHGLQWDGGYITEYTGRGILLGSAALENADFNGVQVRGNSYTSPGTFSGIEVNYGSAIRFNGGKSGGGNLALGSKTQFYGVVIGANAQGVLLDGMDLRDNVTGPILISGSARPQVEVGTVMLDSSNTVASASTIDPPLGHSLVEVTGTTTINNMTTARLGRRMTLVFTEACTVTSAGNIRPRTAFTSSAGSSLSLVFNGTNWIETARAI